MKLPTLNKITIKHLSLYTGPITRKLYPGINMIIGGNGIGKTTFINTILYALVGNASYDRLNENTGRLDRVPLVSADYFRGRIQPEDQESAEVTLWFDLGSHTVEITRTLFRPSIIQLKVKNKKTHSQESYPGSPEKLEKTYRDLIRQLSDVEQFEHFVFTIGHLLLFDEDRRTLAWEKNSEIQNHLIRILFTDKQFDKDYEKVSKSVTEYESLGKHTSERRRVIRENIERWVERKNEVAQANKSGKPESDGNLTQIELRLAKLQSDLESNNEEIDRLRESLETELGGAKESIAKADELELQKVPLTQKLEELEAQFYSKVYENVPVQYIHILETLIQSGQCQLCGTKDNKLKELGKTLKKHGECIVCASPVQLEKTAGDGKVNKQLIEKINAARDEIDKLNAKQAAYSKSRAKAESESNRLQRLINERLQLQSKVEVEIGQLRSTYMRSTGRDPFADPPKDEWLEEQNRLISELDVQIVEYYKRRDEANDRLKKMNKGLVDKLNEVNEELTPLFSQYASSFLGTDCELVVSQRLKNKKPVAYMYPRVDGRDRKDDTQVSESQKFFLDQAFRMALITLACQSYGEPSFYIIETPEGSLDLAYERNVAQMYLKFGEDGHSIVVTSNLNSSDFLKGLYDQLGSDEEKQTRTLDLLHYGRPSPVQQRKESISAFKSRRKQLGLPFEWPGE